MSVKTNGAVQRVAQPADSRVGDFLALLKPRVMSLVVFTGFAGLVVAPGGLHPFLAAVAVASSGGQVRTSGSGHLRTIRAAILSVRT